MSSSRRGTILRDNIKNFDKNLHQSHVLLTRSFDNNFCEICLIIILSYPSELFRWPEPVPALVFLLTFESTSKELECLMKACW